MTLAQRMIVMNAGVHGTVRHARRGLSHARLHLRGQLHRLAPMNLLKTPPGAKTRHHPGHPPRASGRGQRGWAVTVETVRLLGAERLIYNRLNGEQIIVRVEEAPTRRSRRGDHAAAPDRLHAFDATKRIPG